MNFRAPFLSLLFALLFAFAQGARAQTATRAGTSSGRSNQRTGGGTGGSTNRGVSGGSSANSGPRQYRSNTLLGDAIIQIDPESRSLVIITDEETHLEVEKVIKSLDQPRPQVLIKVVFVEVTWDKSLDAGLEGSYTFNFGNNVPGTGTRTTATTQTAPNSAGGTTTTTTNLTQTLSKLTNGNGATAGTLFGLSQLSQGSFVRVMTDDWSATLHALATKGKVEVLSRPSILARNNQEAVIVVGSEVPFVTNSRITENGETINTVTYDNVGIILKVTPFITSEGSVEMIVAPEISALTDQTVPISNNASAPVISKRSAETVVVTPNRTTVVIGGLMETQRTNTIQKVPILGDIPGLGLAFRHKISNDTKRELLIFLTPEIINNTPGLKAATEGEAARTELVKDAFKNGELNRYIDNPLFDEHIPPVESAKEITVTESRPRTTQIHIHKADPLEVKPERKPVDMRDPTPAPVRPGPSTPPSAADAPTPQNSKPIRVRRFEPSKPESTPATQQAPDESR